MEADGERIQINNTSCAVLDKEINLSELEGKITGSDKTLNDPADVISDKDTSVKISSPSTSSSDHEGNEGSLQGPPSNRGSLSWSMEDINVAVVVYPDYLIYGDNYCTESTVTFYCSCIVLEGSNAFGSKESFSTEWSIFDITLIECQWCGTVETAFIKLSIRQNALVQDGAPDIIELKFAVYDSHWLEEQKRIISLNAKYKALWKAAQDTESATAELDCVGLNTENSKKGYLFKFDKHFEDIIYPKGDIDAVSISKRDVELLQPEIFINDTLIDFYVKYLKNKIQPADRLRFHFFNSFFFRKLADLDKDPSNAFEGSAAFQRVRKWTRKVNLFEKDYIFIPVNFNLHWSLIVICHLGEVANFKDEVEKSSRVPCILHMDSIRGSHKGLKNLVQSYLWEEWKARQGESSEDVSSKFFNLRFVQLELPQQENSYDCGLFLLHYVESFLEWAPVNFSPFNITKSSNFLNTDWFPPAEASLKRSVIQKLIHELVEDPPEIPPAACSGIQDSSEFPENVVPKENGLVFFPDRCSPRKACGISSFVVDQGTEMGLSTSPIGGGEYARDQGFIFREMFEPGTTAGFFHNEQFQSFDHRAAPFNGLRCAMSPIEENAEAEQQFAYSQSDGPGSWPPDGMAVDPCTTSYSTKDGRELELLVDPEFAMRPEENNLTDSTPQASSFGSQNFFEFRIDKGMPITNFAIPFQQGETEKSRLGSSENTGGCGESPAWKLETCTVEDSQEITEENKEAVSCKEYTRVLFDGEIVSVEELNLLGDHLQPHGNETGSVGELNLLGDNLQPSGNGSTLVSDKEHAVKRPWLQLNGDDPILEPDEEQHAKKTRLAPSVEDEKLIDGEGLSLLTPSLNIDA